MGEFGTRLREAREQQGLTLAQVEGVTRIRRVFLQALEEERYDELPAAVYARAFVRSYARFLGLDPEEMLAAFQEAAGRSHAATAPRVLNEPLLRRPVKGAWTGIFRGFTIVMVFALLGLWGYSYFYLGVNPWPIEIALPSWWPIKAVSPTATPTPSPTPRVVGATATVKAPTVTPTPTVYEIVTETLVSLATATREPTQAPSPSPTPSLSPTPISGIRVEAEVLADTYVAARSDGQLTFEGILEKGDNRVWIAQEAISLRVGNAAGIKLVVNGVAVAPLGQAGEVATVEYTLNNLPKP